MKKQLVHLAHARSGDKGDKADLSLFAPDEETYELLAREVTAERVKQATGSESEVAFIPYDRVYGQGIEDTLHREPAIGKIKDAIGWGPERNLDVILADVIEHAQHARADDKAEPAEAIESS